MLERGRKNWSGAEDRYLAAWREWRRDFDEKEEKGRAEWEQKTKEHFAQKQKWENDIRTNAAEATIEKVLGDAVNSLNSQLANFAGKHNLTLPALSMLATVNAAVEQMKREQPSNAEKLKLLNASIDQFNTNLSISQMTGADLLGSVLNVAKDMAFYF